MEINNQIAGCAVVTPKPENKRITIINDSKFRKQMNAVIDMNEYLNIIVDMSNVDLIDSTGLGTLISIYNHGRNNNCKIKFCNMSDAVENVIKMTRIDQILETYPTLKAAEESL